MLSKSRIKLIRNLSLPKFRRKEGLFVIEGDKLVREALDPATNPYYSVKYLYGLDPWIEKNRDLLRFSKAECQAVTERELGQISNLTSPNQVLALVNQVSIHRIKPEFGKSLVIALDDIRDPGNMGTIIRLADWFGIKSIILSRDCADPFNPKVIQASMGSVFRVSIESIDLAVFLSGLPAGTPVYGAVLNGNNLFKNPLSDHGIILMGNESKGINEKLLGFISRPVTIPRPDSSIPGPESLNVSTALGIILAEFSRRI